MGISNSGLQGKSAERLAFEFYLRTGRRLIIAAPDDSVDRKFNPYHDPRNGQFTFAPGGPRSAIQRDVPRSRPRDSNRTESDPRSLPRPEERQPTADAGRLQPEMLTDAVYRPDEQGIGPQAANFRLPRRLGPRGNDGPPLDPEPYNPVILQEVFPGLHQAPGGSIIAVADNFLDLTGPAQRLTEELTRAHMNVLVDQIRAINPKFQPRRIERFPTTSEGQANLIEGLRLERAVAFYRRNELRPLQVETLRALQRRVDKAYEKAVSYYNAGRLNVRLSREEAIGNFIDRTVRKQLQDIYGTFGIETSKSGPVRINGREYGTDRTYRIPDARVGNVAIDVTLTQKTLRTPQVRGFFESDFKPDAVIIVRPSQLGPNSTYIIKSPKG